MIVGSTIFPNDRCNELIAKIIHLAKIPFGKVVYIYRSSILNVLRAFIRHAVNDIIMPIFSINVNRKYDIGKLTNARMNFTLCH